MIFPHLTRLGLLSALLAASASAAESTTFRWRIEAGPSIWLKSRVAYGATTGSADPATTPRTDRFYDDGFNRVDASGNTGDGGAGPLPSRTGFFGFSNDSQVDLRAGTLSLHKVGLGEGIYRDAGDVARRPSWNRSEEHTS